MISSFRIWWQQFNYKKWSARLFLSIGALGLIYLAAFEEDRFTKYKELINALFTLGFIWLTYETLRSSNENVDKPSISIEFFGVHDLGTFLESNRDQIIWTDKIASLQSGHQENREYVFVKIENLGDNHAISIFGKIDYEKKNVGQVENSHRKVEINLLKGNTSQIAYITNFDNCSENDYFKLEKCFIKYSSTKRKHAKEKLLKEDCITDSWRPQANTVLKFIGNKK